ncbi:MAG: GTP-binding protein [Gammaproteobacteria bacterium]|nr:GTP-binding protein [Gammaproteobacteria bacterium]
MTGSIPVTILGGYLGSGKTTLVNHLLRTADGVKLAVMVNDFGNLPIDASLIESSADNVINLSGGCVCCSYGNDLTMALLQLLELPTLPDHVLIEASGVALPGAIASSLSLLNKFQTDCVIVLSDSSNVQQQLADRYVGDTVARQLKAADLIILNKLDLIDAEQEKHIQELLQKDYSQSKVINSTYSKVPLQVLLSSGSHTPKSEITGSPTHHAYGFKSIEIIPEDPINVSALAAHLASTPENLIRAKGFATDLDGEMKTIQLVGNRWHVSAAPAHATNGLVCIGLKKDMEDFSINFDAFGTLIDTTRPM